MSKWTHAICVEDFEDRTGRPADSATKMREPDEETCCFCGQATTSGLYIREDPTIPLYCNHTE